MIINQHGKDMMSAHARPPSSTKKSYSAFVAVGAQAQPHVEYVEEGCVVKTTEVDVQESSLSIVATDEDEDEEVVERVGNGKV